LFAGLRQPCLHRHLGLLALATHRPSYLLDLDRLAPLDHLHLHHLTPLELHSPIHPNFSFCPEKAFETSFELFPLVQPGFEN